MTAAQEAQYKVKPDFAIAEHYLEWEDDANGSLAAALTRDLANNVAGQAIVKFVDAFAFASECIVINKHRKKAPIQCLNQCFEPGNWGANQVRFFQFFFCSGSTGPLKIYPAHHLASTFLLVLS